MFSNLTLNSVFWIGLGVILVGFGIYNQYYYGQAVYAAGLTSLGLGSAACGVTNGFTDYSRNGRLLWRIGAALLVIGLLLTGYAVSRFI